MSFVLSLFGLSSPPRPPAAKPTTDAVAPVQVSDVATEHTASREAEARPEKVLLAPDAAEVPIARKIIGGVDGFKVPGMFSGWALDETDPSNPVVVQVLLDGQQIAEGVTSFRRPDFTGNRAENTAGFRIVSDQVIDPEQIVEGKIEVRADGQPIGFWPVLIERLKIQSGGQS